MLGLTRLPSNVRYVLRGTQQFFHFRHHLIFSWVLVLLLVYQDKATLQGLVRLGPKHVCEWHLRRFLCASYWCWRMVLGWLVEAVLAVLPPAADGRVLLVVDGTYKAKTARKHPLVKKGRFNRLSRYVCGLEVLVLMLQWGRFRIPVDVALVRPKTAADYQTANALFRQMLRQFVAPAWAETVLVVADAGFPAKDTLRLIQKRGFFFVMSLPRTWKFADNHTLSNWVKYLPKSRYRKTWFHPPSQPRPRRRVFWTYSARKRLRHLGDVTMVLSKKRRNDSPKQTKILVTNLPNVTARQTIALYARRWDVELLIKELKGATGLGQAQVTKQPQRVERSVALSVMAYLLLIRVRYRDIPHKGPWSAFTLKRNFAWQTAQQQLEQTLHLKMKKAA